MGWSRTNKFPSEAFTPVSAVLPWASMPLDYHDIRMAFVSCVSPTLFQPVGSGSHLYPAHRNTVRSGHGVEGLTDSRGSFPLGLPCPRLLYPYCITTWGVCQEVFEISFKGLFLLGAPLTPGVLWTPLDFSYIVSQLGRFVKGFLVITQKFLREVIQSFGS